MTRWRRGVPALVALLALAAFAAAPAEAKLKRHPHAPPVHPRAHAYNAAPSSSFPVYVDHGVDRNPHGDDLYFNDTKNPGAYLSPNFIVGPGLFQPYSY